MPKNQADGQYLIGRGKLTWEASERRSDRYGFVYLLESGDSTTATSVSAEMVVPPALLGKRCKLTTVVLESRESTHIGDLFHGVFPRTPNVGDDFTLGSGILETQSIPQVPVMVGLRPEDGRESQWLDMRALYDNHEQTVELRVELCPV